jgi:hypothetical protein
VGGRELLRRDRSHGLGRAFAVAGEQRDQGAQTRLALRPDRRDLASVPDDRDRAAAQPVQHEVRGAGDGNGVRLADAQSEREGRFREPGGLLKVAHERGERGPTGHRRPSGALVSERLGQPAVLRELADPVRVTDFQQHRRAQLAGLGVKLVVAGLRREGRHLGNDRQPFAGAARTPVGVVQSQQAGSENSRIFMGAGQLHRPARDRHRCLQAVARRSERRVGELQLLVQISGQRGE